MITDTRQRITAVNRAFSEITGYSEQEALGRSPSLLSSGQHDSSFYLAMWNQLERDGHWQGEIWNRRKTGELYPEWLTISAVHNPQGEITHFVGVFADISTLKYAQARLDYQAHHDPLTGLPNRLLFESRLNHALDEAREESSRRRAVHRPGPLQAHQRQPRPSHRRPAAQGHRRTPARPVARRRYRGPPGGDEFIILLPGLHQESDAEHVARKLLNAFTAPFQADGHEFFVSASVGIALFPKDGDDAPTLVKNADAAMYRAKSRAAAASSTTPAN